MGRYAKNRELRSASYSIRLPVGYNSLGPNDPVDGLIRYNATLEKLEVYLKNKWRPFTTGSVIEYPYKDTFYGDGVARSFGPMRFQYAAGNELFVFVYVGNVFQNPGVAYLIDGYTITFSSTPPLGQPIVILHGLVAGDPLESIPISYRPPLVAMDYSDYNEVFTALPSMITQGNSSVLTITNGVPNTFYRVTNSANANVSVGYLSNIGSANFTVTLSNIGVETFTANFDATDNLRVRTLIVNDPSILDITANYTPTVEGWIAEGGNIAWDITTNGSYSGQTLYFSLHGTVQNSTVPYDLSAFSGSWVVASAQTSTPTVTVVSDILTEGTETVFARIRTGSVSGTIIGTSQVVTIKDTSQTPGWNPASFNYRLEQAPHPGVNEGGSMSWQFYTDDNGNDPYTVSINPSLISSSVVTINPGDFIIENTVINGVTYTRDTLWASTSISAVVANTAVTVYISKLGTVVASNTITIINSV